MADDQTNRVLTKAEWEKMLQDLVAYRTGRRRPVRLPAETDIKIIGNLDKAGITLTNNAITANMADDQAAVEGWALVLMSWCGVRSVVISWDKPPHDTEGKLHYQRFLYRMQRFSALFEGRVKAADPMLFGDLAIGGATRATNPTLSAPSPNRPQVQVRGDPRSERDIEVYLANSPNARDSFSRAFGLRSLDRQLPVGIFDGEPHEDARIFTGGKSAIDLVAIGHNKSLWIFELKKDDNIKVGVLSELFFYSMVMRDLHKGVIALSQQWNAVPPQNGGFTISGTELAKAERLHARVLARNFHPLIDDEIFALLNWHAGRCGWAVDYGLINLQPFVPLS